MKILILNQHSSNHGDEAAGKALIRGLLNSGVKASVGVLYNVANLLEIEKFAVDDNIEHLFSGKTTFIDKVLLVLTFIMPFGVVKYLYRFGSFTKYEYALMNSYDKIINGPGGVNIGPYKDWKYIWRLYVAIKLQKPVAIYSISFGPIPEEYLFKKISKYVLANATFVSLRDNKSQAYADELSISYIKSIDTAFLNNQPAVNLSEDLLESIGDNYAVVVPNQLYKWHPNYKNIEASTFDDIYLKIINYFLNKNLKVVLLPQLFGMQNDSDYFITLKEKSKLKEAVIVIDDKYTSDIQQKIVSKASFLVGARYHTIMFSVNNSRPFLSLAYEHKMTNTLEMIDLSDNNVLMQDIIENKVNILEILDSKFTIKSDILLDVTRGNSQANVIAKQTLDTLINNFLLNDKMK